MHLQDATVGLRGTILFNFFVSVKVQFEYYFVQRSWCMCCTVIFILCTHYVKYVEANRVPKDSNVASLLPSILPLYIATCIFFLKEFLNSFYKIIFNNRPSMPYLHYSGATQNALPPFSRMHYKTQQSTYGH